MSSTMEPGPPDSKRLRLSTAPSSWSARGSQHGVSLLHPTPSPTTTQHQHPQQPQPLPPHPTAPGSYQHPPLPPHHFSRPADQQPPPPPSSSSSTQPSPSQHQQHQHQHQQHQHQHQHQQPPQHIQQSASQPPTPHSQPPPQLPMHPPVDERRHHESDRYLPMQEHRPPPPSPAPSPFPGYPPRDPIVKADPEEPPPHLRRPHSTGAAPEGPPPPSQQHQAMPHHTYPTDKRHMSFDGTPQPQTLYRQPSYPSTPVTQSQPYDYPSYGHAPHDMPFSIPIASTSKRKAQRASQACDNCRTLKAKCDELKPCKSCKEKKVECVYRETAPKQQDKVASEILEQIMAVRNDILALGQRISSLEQYHQQPRQPPRSALQSPSRPRLKEESPPAQFANDTMQVDGEQPRTLGSPGGVADEVFSSPTTLAEAQQTGQPIRVDEDKEDEPGPPVRPGNPAIPLGHTTLAALLLKWRSIEKLVRPSLDAVGLKFIDEFPIRQEEKRGLLRVWGRGEGLDTTLVDREGNQDHGLLEVRDDYSDTGASSPAAPSPADCWGTIGGSPGPVDGKPVPQPLMPLDLTSDTVWKLVRSYEANVQNMHPLLIPYNLREMVNSLLNQVGGKARTQTATGAGLARFVSVPPPHQEAGTKRKRSPGPDGSDGGSPRRLGFQRSITNAVVLMVLALGKICLVKDRKIPNAVSTAETANHGSPLVRNGHPASPSQSSPPSYASHSHSAGLPSPKDNVERASTSASRRASLQGTSTSMPSKTASSYKRNMSVIPGLDYCGYALDIIGSQWGGRSLNHVHFHILAGLYYGQLGRVMDSYAHIKEAGFALHSNMRRKFDRFRRLKDQVTEVTDDLDNQILYAFWTCLQLESDIIAELPVPQSPIMAYEDIIPHPNGTLARHYGFNEIVLQSYLGQLFLRKRLNEIHKTLYDPDNNEIYPEQHSEFQVNVKSMEIVRGLEQALSHEQIIPPAFKFGPDEPPASEILGARLRAKYWGAQVITYRPFVRMVLESNFDAAAARSSTSPLPPPRWPAEFSEAVIDFAAKGVKALTESTRAFHGLEEQRFIITNPFGTAHAQWGNLLTLAAAFKDPTLTRYIREDTLQLLFKKTISFFRITAQPSSALAVDLRILEMLERDLWPNQNPESIDARASSSFSSSASHTGARAPTTPSGTVLLNDHAPGTPLNGMTILPPP